MLSTLTVQSRVHNSSSSSSSSRTCTSRRVQQLGAARGLELHMSTSAHERHWRMRMRAAEARGRGAAAGAPVTRHLLIGSRFDASIPRILVIGAGDRATSAPGQKRARLRSARHPAPQLLTKRTRHDNSKLKHVHNTALYCLVFQFDSNRIELIASIGGGVAARLIASLRFDFDCGGCNYRRFRLARVQTVARREMLHPSCWTGAPDARRTRRGQGRRRTARRRREQKKQHLRRSPAHERRAACTDRARCAPRAAHR